MSDWDPYLKLPAGAKEDVRRAAQATGHSTAASYMRSTILEAVADDLDKSVVEVTGEDPDP